MFLHSASKYLYNFAIKRYNKNYLLRGFRGRNRDRRAVLYYLQHSYEKRFQCYNCKFIILYYISSSMPLSILHSVRLDIPSQRNQLSFPYIIQMHNHSDIFFIQFKRAPCLIKSNQNEIHNYKSLFYPSEIGLNPLYPTFNGFNCIQISRLRFKDL